MVQRGRFFFDEDDDDNDDEDEEDIYIRSLTSSLRIEIACTSETPTTLPTPTRSRAPRGSTSIS